MKLSNAITLARIPLLFLNILLIYLGNSLALPLIALLFFMDYIDGKIARYLDQESKAGATLDIAVDRVIELCLWFYLGFLGYFPLWIPIIVLTRGVLTDSIRNQFDVEPFQVTDSRISRIVISSRFSRGFYGFLKLLTFFMIVIEHLYGLGYGLFIEYLVYLTVAYCLLRGLPVLYKFNEIE